MDQTWDRDGAAAAALLQAVQGFGQDVLDRPDMLEGLLRDSAPQLPREIDVLTTASRVGMTRMLADRLGQQASPQMAVTLAAAEMTSRTAVDAYGAQWAAAEFAKVLGHSAVDPAAGQPTQGIALPTAAAGTGQQGAAFQGQGWPIASPVEGQPGAFLYQGQPAVAPGLGQAPGWPTTGGPTAGATNGLALGTAMLAGVLAVMALARSESGYPLPIVHSPGGPDWAIRLVLAAGFAIGGIVAIRRWQTGDGFAALLGLTLPLASYAFVHTALVNEASGFNNVANPWQLIVLAVAVATAAGLANGRQFARSPRGALAVVLAIAGVCFALANIAPQEKVPFGPSFGILSGEQGWALAWSVTLLALFAIVPLISLLLSRGAAAGLWFGWLAFTLAWQISLTPTGGLSAAPGLYLTWGVWIATLIGTIALAANRPTTGQGNYAVTSAGWQSGYPPASSGATSRPG